MKPIYHQVNQYLDYCESARKMSTNTLRAKHSILPAFHQNHKMSEPQETHKSRF